MNADFIDLEKKWLEILMVVDFPGKEIIERQLAEAYVCDRVVESTYADIFIKTFCQEPYPYMLNAPVGMDVIPEIGTPIAFDLYINTEGFINSLGIDSISGDDIDYHNINFDNVKYDVTYGRHDGKVNLRDM